MTDESRTVPGRYQVASLIMLMLDVLGLLGLLYGTTVVAAKFRQIFADLLESRPLPALARLVLSIPARVALPFFVKRILYFTNIVSYFQLMVIVL